MARFSPRGLSLPCIRRLEPQIRLAFGPVGGPHLRRIRGYSTWTSLNEILAEGGAEVEKLLIPVVLSVSLLTPYTLVCTVAAVIFLAIEPLTDAFFPLSSAYDAVGDQSRLKPSAHARHQDRDGDQPPPRGCGRRIWRAISSSDGSATRARDRATGVLPLVVASFTVTAFVLTATTILLALARVKEVFFMGIAELALAVGVRADCGAAASDSPGSRGASWPPTLSSPSLWIVPYVCRLLGQSPTDSSESGADAAPAGRVPMAAVVLWLDSRPPPPPFRGWCSSPGVAGCVYLVAFYGLSLTAEERRLCQSGIRTVLARAPE